MIALYAIGATVGVSLLSLVGILFFLAEEHAVRRMLLTLVSFSTGALLGDVFLHMLPEMSAGTGIALWQSLTILLGMLFTFTIEKVIRWRHCHEMPEEDGHDHAHHHVHPVGILSVIGESVHNMIDGVVIAVSFLASVPTGIATTLAVTFHEIPHEIGNYAVLLHSGFSRSKALFFNLLSASGAIVGTLLVLFLSSSFTVVSHALLPFAAGNLLYIAGADLIPELHKETRLGEGFLHLIAMIFGMSCMYALLMFE